MPYFVPTIDRLTRDGDIVTALWYCMHDRKLELDMHVLPGDTESMIRHKLMFESFRHDAIGGWLYCECGRPLSWEA